MATSRHVLETVAIIASVALSVIVAGPGGGIENLLLPTFASTADPAQRLRELAFGIPQAILLVPGLGLWAWRPDLRVSGTALTVLPALAVGIDLQVRGRLTPDAGVLLGVVGLLGIYQIVTLRQPWRMSSTRPPALLLAVPAAVVPWGVQIGRLAVEQVRGGGGTGDPLVELVFSVLMMVLLMLPVIRVRAFAPTGLLAALSATIYALMSLRWPNPLAAMPQVMAILAVAAAVAYADTIRQLAYGTRADERGDDNVHDGQLS